jgi:hypothetical protein
MNRKWLACIAAVALALVAGDLDAQYTISMGAASAGPGGSPVVDAQLDNNGGPIAGWSYGVCNGPEVTPTSVGLGDCATVKNGSAADFNERATFPGGWTQGVVICFIGCATVAAGTQDFVMASATYSVDGAAAEGDYPLNFCNTLGNPPVSTVVVVSGASIVPTQEAGAITVLGVVPFVRGDANDDALINIADGVWILNDLFQGGPHTDCFGANDSNGDGTYDAADGVYIFNYQFLNGPAPSAPFPSCGTDADPSPSDCAGYTSC